MAGHSKWKNIRIRKGKQDAIRGKLFTKLGREIIVAAKAGGGDPATNARLRVAIDRAKEESLPKENIDRAIKRGTGEIEGEQFEELVYEGYGPGGSALMVEVYTENRNRTVAELRHAFNKNGGSLGENGSVAWQFKYVGQILVPKAGQDEDNVTLAALDAGAEDVGGDDEHFVVETRIENLHSTNDGLMKSGIRTTEVELARIPTNFATPSPDDIRKIVKLVDALEELDDVKETYVNVEIADEYFEED
ncbi:MAG: YebC/PmpR family DNA-binding transcriptional regulator [Fimbriimonadaceae bacterium]|nr:YebC/PmpR family DNA-binding transcriptional regulator [Fimbriimonadaceae bacterium]